MHIKVRRTEFLNELTRLQGAVSTKQNMPYLTHLLIETGFGKIRMRATDLDLTMTTECPADMQAMGAICLPARKLMEIVKSLPNADIEVKSNASFQAAITCRSSKLKLNGMDSENFPGAEEYSGPYSEVPSKILSRFIRRVIHAAAHEEGRLALNGAKLEISKERIRMVATNGHRLALIERKGEFGEPIDLIIQRKALIELAKLCEAGDETLRIGKTKNKIHFKIGAREMTSQLLTGNYPNYSDVLPKENHKRFTVGRVPVLGTINRVAIMVAEQQRAIKVEICDGEMRISSVSSDAGEANETVPIDYSGEPISAGFNAAYLRDFLAAIEDEEEVSFEFKDGKSPAQLSCVPSNQDRCFGVIMPMDLSGR